MNLQPSAAAMSIDLKSWDIKPPFELCLYSCLRAKFSCYVTVKGVIAGAEVTVEAVSEGSFFLLSEISSLFVNLLSAYKMPPK